MEKCRFFICEICGNIVGKIHDAGVDIFCCGQPMEEMTANTVEASVEKHLPVVSREGDILTVKVGSDPHPMIPAHLIEWVYIETQSGGQRKALAAGDEPVAKFAIVDDTPIAAYAYCNLHGLWKTEIK